MTTAVLALVLAAPLQSWGSASRFERRDTDGAPTKSGVLGLLAACDGRRRVDSIEDLLTLRLGVRTDMPGVRLRDFHTMSRATARDPRLPTASGGVRPVAASTLVSTRYYLGDAVFSVFVEGERDLVAGLADAVLSPVYAPALGRRSCPPGRPLIPHLIEGELQSAFESFPWQAPAREQRRITTPIVSLPVIADDPEGTEVLYDVPLSRQPANRTFGWRRVSHSVISVPTGAAQASQSAYAHDPFSLL